MSGRRIGLPKLVVMMIAHKHKCSQHSVNAVRSAAMTEHHSATCLNDSYLKDGKELTLRD